MALYYLQYDRAKVSGLDGDAMVVTFYEQSYFERAGDMAHIAFTLMGKWDRGWRLV